MKELKIGWPIFFLIAMVIVGCIAGHLLAADAPGEPHVVGPPGTPVDHAAIVGEHDTGGTKQMRFDANPFVGNRVIGVSGKFPNELYTFSDPATKISLGDGADTTVGELRQQRATIQQLQRQLKELQIRAQYDAKVMGFYQGEAIACQAQPPAKAEEKK